MVATASDHLLHPACETVLCRYTGLGHLGAGIPLVLTELAL